jgi:hypothetical protein
MSRKTFELMFWILTFYCNTATGSERRSPRHPIAGDRWNVWARGLLLKSIHLPSQKLPQSQRPLKHRSMVILKQAREFTHRKVDGSHLRWGQLCPMQWYDRDADQQTQRIPTIPPLQLYQLRRELSDQIPRLKLGNMSIFDELILRNYTVTRDATFSLAAGIPQPTVFPGISGSW